MRLCQFILLFFATVNCKQANTLEISEGKIAPIADSTNKSNLGKAGKFSLTYEPWTVNEKSLKAVEWLKTNKSIPLMLEALNKEIAIPADIPITFKSLPSKINAWYNPKDVTITFSYEFASIVFNVIAADFKNSTEQIINDVVSNAITFVVMHEIGHALRHQLNLPITGKEEDVVDEFATLSLITKGQGDAAAAGAVTFLSLSKKVDKSVKAYFDEHSLGEQRFAEIYCMIYGSDPEKHKKLVGKVVLAARAQKCISSYNVRLESWNKLLSPFEKKP